MKNYVETLNTPGAVPNVQTAWQVFIKEKCSQTKKDAREKYEEGMSGAGDLVPCKTESIRELHDQALEACLQLFRSEMEGISVANSDAYLTQLTVSLQSILDLFVLHSTSGRHKYTLQQHGCWPIGSVSASHQCGPDSIPGWGSDPGAISEKGLSSPV